MAKISINCCLVASIGVANTLAEVCERVGANWHEIVPALKLDRRIGEHAYLAPGLGLAGGNLERDLETVCRLAAETGSEAGIVHAWLGDSRYRRDWALRTLHRAVLEGTADPLITVLGLAYKEDTNSTKNSPALALIRCLSPFRLAIHDPIVSPTAAGRPEARYATDPVDACRGADAVVIMTPWAAYRAIDPEVLAGVMAGRTLIDPFGVLDERSCRAAGFDFFSLGRQWSR